MKKIMRKKKFEKYLAFLLRLEIAYMRV